MTYIGMYNTLPTKDHYAILHFIPTDGKYSTRYYAFENRKEFTTWVEQNRDEKYHAFVAKGLNIEVKVDVLIKNFDKNIDEELTEKT